MEFDLLTRLDRMFRAVQRHAAVEELARHVRELGDRVSPNLLGTLVGWLASDRQMQKAIEFNERLARIDPWRAAVEALMLRFRRNEDARFVDVNSLAKEGKPREAALQARLHLAVGKLATLGGDLVVARLWLLGALSTGRRACDDGTLAAAYGALGELLYLGQQPLAALDLLNLDFGLLPVHSAERNRLRIHRAHCYRRLDQPDVARGLYAEARWLAEIDPSEFAHGFRGQALRGSAWLDAQEWMTNPARVESLERLALLGADEYVDETSRAHTWVALGLVAKQRGDHALWLDHQNKASSLFAKAGRLVERGVLERERFLPIRYSPPESSAVDVCDEWLLDLPLKDRQEQLAALEDHLHKESPSRALEAWTAAFF